jgi:uncharacterized phosphosugar-binding protein
LNPARAYIDAARAIVDRIEATQVPAIERAAEICTTSIAGRGLVHLFGSGHSRIPVEEIFPRHGSFPGFHPIVELSLTFHNQVVGANGQRQAMLLEKVEGLADAILRNFVLEAPDSFMIFSNSGVNAIVVEMALGAKKRGLPVIAVVSLDHCLASSTRHSSGKRLPDIADLTIDTCVPAGDAMVQIDGLDDPVGPGSSIGAVTIVNAIKCLVAEKLTRLGQPPIVLSSSYVIGEAAVAQRFEDCYNDYRNRVRRVYGRGE